MDQQVALTLAIIAAAIALFWLELVSIDVVALGVLLTLILTGLLPRDQAFAGFGSDAVMLILGLLILSASLSRTGVVELLGRRLAPLSARPRLLVWVVMVAALLVSALMSNTAATAVFLPVVVGLARRARLSPSRLLLPLAFAAILSSCLTLISTSTNIVVSGLLAQSGLPPLDMFELTWVGIPIALTGLLYMGIVAPRLLPERAAAAGPLRGERAFLTEVLLRPESSRVGRTVRESRFREELDLTILGILRRDRGLLVPDPDLRLESGDILLAQGDHRAILAVRDRPGIEIRGETELSLAEGERRDLRLAEAIVPPRSPLLRRTLAEVSFRERFGLQVLAMSRFGETLSRRISRLPVRLGDLLIVQGDRERLLLADSTGVLRVLGEIERAGLHYRRAPLAVAIFVAAVSAGALELVSLPVAVLCGALLVFATGCISPEEAYREVEWRAIILIGSMLALGRAMDASGTDRYLAGLIAEWSAGASPLWLLGGFFLLALVLTQPMSNQAAAVVVVPIALETARTLSLNPRTFAVMIAVAASCSFLTPLEPACLMVYGPGGYRFRDFVRVGLPLTALIFAIALLLVPRLWPLAAPPEAELYSYEVEHRR